MILKDLNAIFHSFIKDSETYFILLDEIRPEQDRSIADENVEL